MNKNDIYDFVIIGGGFFGLYISEYLARRGKSVLLCEKENDLMQRASYCNQARVHNGYHYPRSILTALRSRISFPCFIEEFPDCIVSDFEKFYMIGKVLGKISAHQFKQFCNRIGAVCELTQNRITELINPNLIEAVFSTVEYVFDAVKLKRIMINRINEANVTYKLNTFVDSIYCPEKEYFELTIRNTEYTEQISQVRAKQVFNCAYSMLNKILKNSGIELIPLKHELTEMCLIEPPDWLNGIAITVMCGPFFSIMPFPSKNLYTFSHVRYTPHYEWYDDNNNYIDAHKNFENAPKNTSWKKMLLDSMRYIPQLKDCKYVDSLWEIKTVLPRSEVDDSRPILFKPNYWKKGFHCVMGGKIDNIYDVIKVIENMGII